MGGEREKRIVRGKLTILYVGKLDLKSKTKISPADLISVVPCSRACQNYVQTVATEEELWNEVIREPSGKDGNCGSAIRLEFDRF